MNYPILFTPSALLAALLLANSTFAQDSTVELETVKVSADFRQLDLQQIPSAITVVSEDDIKKRNADHLESILSLAPNVNYSAGASRGRYFQIRGIGERSQFVDAVNPSVALIIDGVDMTGLGGAATLFDVGQVEILRGPQGTAFGANALAGAINIKSKQPTKETEGYIAAEVGNYGKKNLGGAVSGALSSNVQGRLSINKTLSDGYMENVYLNRDDTNNIDETVARAQLSWKASENNNVHFSLLKADINNGYDAFSLDNNHTTYSDTPGKDTQDTTASSIKWENNSNKYFNIEVLASYNESDIVYAYDEDWAFDGIHAGGYNAEDEYLRDYQRSNIDIRLLSSVNSRLFSDTTNWLVGTYILDRKENLTRNYFGEFTSELEQDSSALYGQLSSQLNNTSTLTYGLRVEEWNNNYTDSNSTSADNTETLWGGKITLESLVGINHLAYASLTRGYKAGGVNSDNSISEDNRIFDTEFNNSVELGLKSSLLNDELTTRLAIFYIQRKDQQVKVSENIADSGNAPSFKEYYDNATEGRNYGLELESNWNLTQSVTWQASVGYLKTKLLEYSFTGKYGTLYNNDGRSQAHAPEYSIASSIDFTATQNISLNVGFEAKDEYYFSDSHDEKSKAYILLHASIRYTRDNLELSLNGHNLTDKDYAVRGFGFDNDPRDGKNPAQHTQLGAPRLVSLSARYQF
jgi:iron complex outermembrane receptor protein